MTFFIILKKLWIMYTCCIYFLIVFSIKPLSSWFTVLNILTQKPQIIITKRFMHFNTCIILPLAFQELRRNRQVLRQHEDQHPDLLLAGFLRSGRDHTLVADVHEHSMAQSHLFPCTSECKVLQDLLERNTHNIVHSQSLIIAVFDIVIRFEIF